MKLLEFLQEDNGGFSSMRLVVMMIVGLYVFQGVWQVLHNGKIEVDFQQIITMLGAMWLKERQKTHEQKVNPG